MKGKLKIIILAVIAITSFGASYFLSPRLGGSGGAPPATKDQTKAPEAGAAIPLVPIEPASAQAVTIAMKRQELQTLITELRLKLDNCRTKEKELAESEKRNKIAEEVLKKQAQELEKLRLGLIPALQRYQEIKKEAETSQIRITVEEDKNIKLLAGRYDAMDSDGAAKILTDLWTGSQQDLAVKILYYMQARSAAKVLAAVSASKTKGAAELAARLSEKFQTVQKPSQKEG